MNRFALSSTTTLAALLMTGAIVSLTAATAPAADKPNIILIMADDLGYAELGIYGQEKIKTPHLDQMAAGGMRFTQFYCGAPVCAPSRCVLMTGMHLAHSYVRDNWEHRNGKWDNFGGQLPLPKGTATLGTQLKAAGYTTGCFGKWGLGGVGTIGDPLKQGFDRFVGYNCQRHAHNLYPRYVVVDDTQRMLPGNDRGRTGKTYGPQVVADEMLKFIRENKDRPFFVYYPTLIPHLPLQAPEEDIAAYKGKWNDPPYKGRSYQPHDTPRACYAAMISFMDKQVGRIVALLKELELDDNTIILFTSDNGVTHLKDQVDYDFFKSSGPLRGLKGSAYEGGIRVPLIASWPGKIKPGTTSDHISGAQDFMPTLCDLAGVGSPPTDGISLLPTLQGKANRQKEHKYLVWEFHGYGGQQAVREGDWKAIRRNCFKNPDGPIELYNLADDLGEQKNVAAQHPDIVKKMADIMVAEHGVSPHWDYRKGHPMTRNRKR